MDTTAQTHHEASKPGMPQLDPTYFASQLFWLAVVLLAMYVLMSRWAVPRIARVLETREQRIAADLAQAEDARQQAQAAVDSYEKTMLAAKTAANGALTSAQANIAEHQAAELAKLDTHLSAEINHAEAQIRAKAEQVQAQLVPCVAEISEQIASAVLRMDTSADVGARKLKA